MFSQQLVNGIMLGSTYALIGVSFTLILGVLDMLNLALGEVFMLGAFAALTLVKTFQVPFVVALLGGMLAAGIVSLVVELFAFRLLQPDRFRLNRLEIGVLIVVAIALIKLGVAGLIAIAAIILVLGARFALRDRQPAPFLSPLLSTIGFSILLQNLATIIWGSDQQQFPRNVGNGDFHIGDILVSQVQLVILATAIVLAVALELIISRTKIGRGMRAVAEDREAAAILGVDSRTVILFTFFVAGALAGAAGVLIGLTFSAISPFMGTQTGLKGIAVMVVGGMGNVRGAMLAGLLLGICEVLAVGYLSASYRDMVVYGLLILVLIVRPSGLLGTQQQVARV